MKKLKELQVRLMSGTITVEGWDIGVPGLAIFKRADDPKSSWNVLHLASGLCVLTGYRTRADVPTAWFRWCDVDWTVERPVVPDPVPPFQAGCDQFHDLGQGYAHDGNLHRIGVFERRHEPRLWMRGVA